MRNSLVVLIAIAICLTFTSRPRAAEPKSLQHPRLYFTATDLPRLRKLRQSGMHAKIWANLTRSADWCRQQPPRTEWIPTLADDPQYENLYDRFYAAMHDMAIIEHLAFASVLSDPNDDPYFESAKAWLLAGSRVWKHEADNKPDASKAYAVLRVMKSLAVGYDLLYDRLNTAERQEVRDCLTAVCGAYFEFFQDPVAAGAGYNKHHGSVDAAPQGIVALALLGEVPAADAWLKQMIQKHVDYLLPHALTPSGTSDQTSNFWASTLHYRIFFMEALRRVTGRDLFREFPDSTPGRIALAAIAGKQPQTLQQTARYNESNRNVLFGPSYGQLDYWSPVLVFLAREQQRPIYQYLAGWDESLGGLQRSRYITPTKKEELLFSFGGYIYLWYDPAIPAAIEENLPRSFEFPEPEVNEAYLRDTYTAGDIVVGFKKGGLIVHAGGRPVLVDMLETNDVNKPAEPIEEMLVADDGRLAKIRCVGPKSAGISEQKIELHRPGRLSIHRQTTEPITWWLAGKPGREGNTFTWQDGTMVTISTGTISKFDERGFVETKTHYAGMKYADPMPMVYPTVTVQPDQGIVEIEITSQTPTPEKTPTQLQEQK